MLEFLKNDVVARYASKRQKQIAKRYHNVLGGPHGVALQSSAMAGLDVAVREWRSGGMPALRHMVEDRVSTHRVWEAAVNTNRKILIGNQPVSGSKLANHKVMMGEMQRMLRAMELYAHLNGIPVLPKAHAKSERFPEPMPR